LRIEELNNGLFGATKHPIGSIDLEINNDLKQFDFTITNEKADDYPSWRKIYKNLN
jgi:hypothetical protein